MRDVSSSDVQLLARLRQSLSNFFSLHGAHVCFDSSPLDRLTAEGIRDVARKILSGVPSLETLNALIYRSFDRVAAENIHLSEDSQDPAERWAFLELIGQKLILMRNERRKIVSGKKPDIHDPESTDLLSRLRFGRRVKVQTVFQYLGPRIGKGMSLYTDALSDVWGDANDQSLHVNPPTVGASVNRICWSFANNGWKMKKFKQVVVFFTFGLVFEDDVLSMLKFLSGYVKKFGCGRFSKLFGGDPFAWRAFVNLETLGGFKEVIEDDLRDQIIGWRGGDIIHKSVTESGVLSYTEEAFLDDFRRGAGDFFALNLKPNPGTGRNLLSQDYFSFDYFASHPALWGGSGSSSELNPIPGARKSKWTTALGYQNAIVSNWLAGQGVQQNKVIGKRETGKIRAVIASDDKLYLAMAYISHWVESLAKGHTISTLFMSAPQVVSLWSTLCHSCQAGQTVKLPLDQSHFDWQQNKRMLHIVVDCIQSYVMPFVNVRVRADVQHAFGFINQAFDNPNSYVFLRKTGEYFSIDKGVMSGWRWTALIDTICNFAEMYCACSFCRKMGILAAPINLCVQGDDDCVEFENARMAGAICEAYKLMHFDVNPGKFFMSRVQNEYLRIVATGNGVCAGYPSRAVSSLIARNPLTVDPPKGVFRIRECFSQWCTLFGRLISLSRTPNLMSWSRSRCHALMLQDVCGATGLSRDVVFRIEHTPAIFGGLGVYPWVDNRLMLGISVSSETTANVMAHKYGGGLIDKTPRTSWTDYHWTNVTEFLPGLSSDVHDLKTAGFDVDDRQLNQVLSSVLRPKKTLPSPVHTALIVPNLGWDSMRKATKWIPILNWDSHTHMPTPKFCRVLADSVLKNAAVDSVISRTKSSNYRTMCERMLDQSSWSDSDFFWLRGGKRMWAMWLRGDLETAQLTKPGLSSSALGLMNMVGDNWIWSRISMMGKFTHSDWMRCCLSLQQSVDDLTDQLVRHFGCLMLS